MRIRNSVVGLTLFALLASSPAFAQQHVADAAAMQQAIADQATTDTTNRQAVLQALERDDVRQLAATWGVDLQQARSAVATMTSTELQQLAQPAQALAADQAAGANVVVISVTTLLLLLILIIVIAK